MDGQRFDDLARLMGAGADRRRVLKALAGGAAGGLAALLGRRLDTSATVACAVDGDACADDITQGGTALQCCEDLVCVGGYCEAACIPEGSGCAPTAQGEDGDPCCDGSFCSTETGNCEASCGSEFDFCDVDEDCCAGYTCEEGGKGGVCTPVQCAAEGEECGADEDCCAGICCAGACRNIECCIDEEDPNARCPEGTSCFEGQCDPICGVDGGTCDDDGDCCEGYVCLKTGVCAVACSEADKTCDDDYDCCGDLVCLKTGVCGYHDNGDDGGDDGGSSGGGTTGGTSSGGTTAAAPKAPAVTALPTTGVADGAGSGNLLLGAGLAAGAAALLAANKLRKDAAADPAE